MPPAIAVALLSACPLLEPLLVPAYAYKVGTREIGFPVRLDDARRDEIGRLRLFVSDDRGRSWKQVAEYEAAVERMAFKAPADGLYWFSLQTVSKQGRAEPSDPQELRPIQKVFVDTSGKHVPARKSYEELARENEELRGRVDALEKKLAGRDRAKP